MDLGCIRAFTATSVVQEANLTFMRQNTDLNVKQSKLMFDQSLQLEDIDVKMSPALLKVGLELCNLYHKCKHIASVKHAVLGKLQDREFLLANIIPNTDSTI